MLKLPIKSQFKYADKIGARLVILVGGDEYARGDVKIRDMQTKEEAELPLEKAAEKVLRLLNA